MSKLVKNIVSLISENIKSQNIVGRTDISNVAFGLESISDAQQDPVSAPISLIGDIVDVAIHEVIQNYPTDVSFNEAQIAAAKDIAVLAVEPGAIQSNPLKENTGTFDFSYDSDDFAASDVVVPAVESFDGRSVENSVPFSVVTALLSSQQDEVNALLYPMINIPPAKSDIVIKSTIVTVHNNVSRSIDGSPVISSDNPINIIKQRFDRSVFGVDRTRNIPVSRPESAAFMLTTHEYIDNSTGVEILTAPLMMGVKIDILSISQTNEQLSKGVLNSRDSLDRVVNLERVYFTITGMVGTVSTKETFFFDATKMSGSNFTHGVQNDSKGISLSFSTRDVFLVSGMTTQADGTASAILGTLPAGTTIRVEVGLHGNGNVTDGVLAVYPLSNTTISVTDSVGNPLPPTTAAYIDATAIITTMTTTYFTQLSHLSNATQRNTSPKLTNKTITTRYGIPYRRGFSIDVPLNKLGDEGDEELTSNIATLSRNSNLCGVTALFEVAAHYESISANNLGDTTSVTGIGKHYMNFFFQRDAINLIDYVDSRSSGSRMEDVSSALIGILRNAIMTMTTSAGVSGAYAHIRGGSGGPIDIAVVCSVTLASYITPTDSNMIQIGSGFRVKVAGSEDPLFGNSIIITLANFSNPNRNSEVDPLSHGTLLWVPTITTDTNRVDGNSVFRSINTTPRYRHIDNAQVMYRIDVSGLPDVLRKVPTLTRTLA